MLGQISLFTILLLGVSIVRSQVPFPNPCPGVKTLHSFDVDKFMGAWYSQFKYPVSREDGKICSASVYTNNGDGTLGITFSSVSNTTNIPSSTHMTATIIAPGQLALLPRNSTIKVDKPNWILLGTDYVKWALIYSCANTASGHTKKLWISARERIPTDMADVLLPAEQVMRDNNLSEAYLVQSDQKNCPIAAN